MKDQLGDRMKSQYESRTKYFLPRRTYTIIRLDGKAFHTFTKGFKRPYDLDLMWCMDETTRQLCENIQGVKLAYTQSDEISLLLTDFEKDTSQAFFDGQIQKIASVAASMATAFFNQAMMDRQLTDKLAFFDARVFSIPDPIEVENYFIWRQQDCVRNSISMTAQSLYSHKELHGKNTNKMQDMCIVAGVNWNDQPAEFKRGRMAMKVEYQIDPEHQSYETSATVTRTRWVVKPAIWITRDRSEFSALIPKLKYQTEKA
jgi:tRNA(His) 5'-end guanylyltransferase